MSRHRNIAIQTVPYWAWVMLAWFASDNIISWLSSPILFYPLVLIGVALVAAWNLGLMPVILGVVVPQIKT